MRNGIRADMPPTRCKFLTYFIVRHIVIIHYSPDLVKSVFPYIPIIQSRARNIKFDIPTKIVYACETLEKEKTMKTKAIKRCIDNGSDVRDALEAQVELYAIEAEFANKLFVGEEMIMGIIDTLQDLIDVQNGCPLPKYQEEYDRANASAIQLIERLGHKLNYDDYSPNA